MNLTHLLIISGKLTWINEKIINIINCHVALLLLLKFMFYFILMIFLKIILLIKKLLMNIWSTYDVDYRIYIMSNWKFSNFIKFFFQNVHIFNICLLKNTYLIWLKYACEYCYLIHLSNISWRKTLKFWKQTYFETTLVICFNFYILLMIIYYIISPHVLSIYLINKNIL